MLMRWWVVDGWIDRYMDGYMGDLVMNGYEVVGWRWMNGWVVW
jgi:hypothetical protein